MAVFVVSFRLTRPLQVCVTRDSHDWPAMRFCCRLPVMPYHPRPRNQRSPVARALRVPIVALTWITLIPLLRLIDLCGATQPLLRSVGWLGSRPRVWRRRWGNYIPDARDVIVGSYPKSGTTWGLQIAQQIVSRGKAEYGHIHDVVAWPDMVTPDYAIELDNPGPALANATGMRVIKTHCPWPTIPYSPDAHYILIVRDPKDVFTSSYPFIKGAALGPLMPSVANFYRFFLSPHFLVGGWAAHAHGYASARDRPNVLFLSFKEMKQDLARTIARVADHLGVSLEPDELIRIQKNCSFDEMKAQSEKFDPGAQTPFSTLGTPLVRRGRQGGSDEMISPDQQREIDATFIAQLRTLGSDLDYGSIATPAPPASALDNSLAKSKT
jgi:hypothetical protein